MISTMRRRRRVQALAALALVALAGAACGSSSPQGAATKVPAKNALDSAKGVTTVTFWDSMDGSNGTALTHLVQQFNDQNKGKIQVKAVFQGQYDDAITKYKAAVQAKKTPSLIQVYDIGSRFMIDSKQTVPMQKFIDRDKFDTSDLQPNITGYYSIDKQLYSMPFNTSMPVLYYDMDAFKKAGLDPNNPPKTLDEVRAAAQKLTIKDRSGKVTRYGFGAAIYGWFLEQWTATAGKNYCDNGNGRTKKASKVDYSQPADVGVVDWWTKMVKDGLAVNTGRDTNTASNAFKAGRVAMHVESTGSLTGYVEAAKAKHFQLGVGFYPKAGDASGGPIIGGASLWINGPGHSAAELEASWRFVKFLATPQSQAYWHINTGYFPINKKALDTPEDTAYRQKLPQFDVAVRQLESTKLTTATQGCLLGVMPQARADSEDAIEKAILGQASASDALKGAEQAIAPQISSYNNSTG